MSGKLLPVTAFGAIGSGFARVFRQPRALAAEIAWRWSLGGALLTLAAVAGYRYLDSIIVIGGDPRVGLWARTLRLVAVMFAGTTVLSILAAASGRSAALPLLFRRLPARPRFRALTGNAFLRAALALSAALGILLACRLALRILAGAHSGGGWFIVALAIACAMILVALLPLWLVLSIAPLFSVSQDCDTLNAVAGAVELIQRRPGAGVLIWITFSVLRLGWFSTAFGFAMGVVAAAAPLSRTIAIVIFCAGLLVTFAGGDFLRLCSLGAFAALIDDVEPVEISTTPAPTPQSSLYAPPAVAVLPS